MQDVSLQELLTNSFNYSSSKMYTSIPCIVMKVHDSLNACKVDVQPSVKNLYKSGAVEEHPPILGVPVMFPASKTSSFTFPINIGDTVLCVFASKSIDNFKLGSGAPTIPNDYRRFDKRDAIAIPGLFPFSASINSPSKHTWTHSTQDAVVAHNLGTGNEVEVRLKANGDCVVSTNQKVIVNCQDAVVNSTTVDVNASSMTVDVPNSTWTGNITLNGNLTQTGTYTLAGITMNTHKHTGVSTGPSQTGGPV